jgi:DNA-binding MarR family transcriptional regulator
VAKQPTQTPEPDLLRTLAEFRATLRRFLQFSEDAAARAGLTTQQHQLLLQIAGAPAEELVTVAYVADKLGLRHHSAVELCNRSEEVGLLRRASNLDNRRQVLLSLTASGTRALRKLTDDHASELDEQAPHLIAALQKIRALRGKSTSDNKTARPRS